MLDGDTAVATIAWHPDAASILVGRADGTFERRPIAQT
jgi:hypothetical protein